MIDPFLSMMVDGSVENENKEKKVEMNEVPSAICLSDPDRSISQNAALFCLRDFQSNDALLYLSVPMTIFIAEDLY